jgi:hypothetical protein
MQPALSLLFSVADEGAVELYDEAGAILNGRELAYARQ